MWLAEKGGTNETKTGKSTISQLFIVCEILKNVGKFRHRNNVADQKSETEANLNGKNREWLIHSIYGDGREDRRTKYNNGLAKYAEKRKIRCKNFRRISQLGSHILESNMCWQTYYGKELHIKLKLPQETSQGGWNH